MNQRFLGTILALFVILSSIAVMLAPTVFTKGVSRLESKKSFELSHILSEKKDIEIIFFGYSGCQDICSPRLESLGHFYKEADVELKKHFGLVFVDISSPEDKELPQRFAKYFDKDFRGVYLDKVVLREYTKAFDVFYAEQLMNSLEYDHTANLYIVKKENNMKEIRYVYTTYPYDLKQIQLDLEELINE
jgi:protein SCO1/2